MKIKEMSMESRPREKALRFGFGVLSDLELVAILLGSGSHNRSVFDIAQDLLDKSDNLANLYGMKVEDLTSISGIREARALKILSGIELCKRALRTQVYRTRITHPDQLIGWFEMEYGWLDREHFVAVFLDTKGNILSHRTLFIGTLNESTIHPRDIFKEAFVKNAYSVILIHNHPSGDPSPSQSDIDSTKRIKKIAKMMGIVLLDHIIVGHNKSFSFRQAKYLD